MLSFSPDTNHKQERIKVSYKPVGGRGGGLIQNNDSAGALRKGRLGSREFGPIMINFNLSVEQYPSLLSSG